MSPRWIGIRVSAVISILGSLALLLIAGLMLVSALMNPPAPEAPAPPFPIKYFLIGMANVVIFLAAWGIATAVGIFRRRRWARMSILIFSALLELFGVLGAAMMAVIPLPETPGADPRVMSFVRAAIVGFYCGLAAIGTWWLVLFNLQRSQPYFSGPVTTSEPVRPLSITIISGYFLFGALCCLPMALFRFPFMFMGIIFKEVGAVCIYLALVAVQLYLGLGLLRLSERARVTGIAYFCVMLVSGIISVVPSRQQELMRQMRLTYSWMNQPGQANYEFQHSWPFTLLMLLLAGLPIFFLIRRRAAFLPFPPVTHSSDTHETASEFAAAGQVEPAATGAGQEPEVNRED
jgi:hypothetical protein